jgi:hypothetical protein
MVEWEGVLEVRLKLVEGSLGSERCVAGDIWRGCGGVSGASVGPGVVVGVEGLED